MTDVMERLHVLEDPHIEFTILRACVGAVKFSYALRGVPPTPTVLKVAQDADTFIRKALERILQDGVTHDAWTQAGLAPSFGGMGVRHCEDIAHAAFIGSSLDSASLTLRLLGKRSMVVPGLQQAAQGYVDFRTGSQVPLGTGILICNLAHNPISDDALGNVPKKAQQYLQEPLDKMRFDELRQQAAGNDRDRLDACKRDHASAWLSCFPIRNLGLHLAPAEFTTASRFWLGLTNRVENRAILRPGVGMYGRHHALQECMLSLCATSGVTARREVLIDTSGQRPADVYLPSFSRGMPVAIDITVSHPSQSTTITGDDVANGMSASVKAALDKVDLKNRKYTAQCQSRGVVFQAVAVCTFGGWLQDGDALVSSLASRAANRSGGVPGTVLAQFRQRLSITLWRSNARQILHCLA